jgi:hypothetical protein
VFPGAGDADQETITVIGKKDSVEKAVAELQERIAALVTMLMLWSIYTLQNNPLPFSFMPFHRALERSSSNSKISQLMFGLRTPIRKTNNGVTWLTFQVL